MISHARRHYCVPGKPIFSFHQGNKGVVSGNIAQWGILAQGTAGSRPADDAGGYANLPGNDTTFYWMNGVQPTGYASHTPGDPFELIVSGVYLSSDENNRHRVVIAKHDGSGTDSFQIRWNGTSNVFECFLNDGVASETCSVSGAITTNYDISMRYDGTDFVLDINGTTASIAPLTRIPDFSSLTIPWSIGCRGTSGSYPFTSSSEKTWKGRISGGALFPRVLSVSERAAAFAFIKP